MPEKTIEKQYSKTNAQLMVETDYCYLEVHNPGKTNLIPCMKFNKDTRTFQDNPDYKS